MGRPRTRRPQLRRDSLGSMPMHHRMAGGLRPDLALALTATLTAVACQDPVKPLLTPSRIVGAWVLVLNSPPACASSGAGQQLHLDLAFSGHSQSPTGVVTGGWDFDSRVPPRYGINGTLDLRSGHLVGSLWQQEAAIGSALDVVLPSADSLRGELTDPAPGASGNFTGGPCVFEVSGHR
jgi:hypothetical protein